VSRPHRRQRATCLHVSTGRAAAVAIVVVRGQSRGEPASRGINAVLRGQRKAVPDAETAISMGTLRREPWRLASTTSSSADTTTADGGGDGVRQHPRAGCASSSRTYRLVRGTQEDDHAPRLGERAINRGDGGRRTRRQFCQNEGRGNDTVTRALRPRTPLASMCTHPCCGRAPGQADRGRRQGRG
jgi:hypothetical protein